MIMMRGRRGCAFIGIAGAPLKLRVPWRACASFSPQLRAKRSSAFACMEVFECGRLVLVVAIVFCGFHTTRVDLGALRRACAAVARLCRMTQWVCPTMFAHPYSQMCLGTCVVTLERDGSSKDSLASANHDVFRFVCELFRTAFLGASAPQTECGGSHQRVDK